MWNYWWKCRMLKNLEFKISNKEKDLSLKYWIPKMYKNSCGKRFTIAWKLWSKQLSKSISPVFKLIYNQTENFQKKLNFLKIIINFGNWKILILSLTH